MMSETPLYTLLCLGVAVIVTGERCTKGDVRLSNGTEFAGRVEVCVDDYWGTLCDQRWTRSDAKLVCNQLNFTVSNFHDGILDPINCGSACFGEGSGIVYYKVCPEGALNLSQCDFQRREDSSQCHHHEDAGVICLPHLCGIGQDSAAKSSPCQCTSKSSGPNRSSRLLEGVLGMLVGVLALLLIGTIIGWMTTWQRMKDRYISSSVNGSSFPSMEQQLLTNSYSKSDNKVTPSPTSIEDDSGTTDASYQLLGDNSEQEDYYATVGNGAKLSTLYDRLRTTIPAPYEYYKVKNSK